MAAAALAAYGNGSASAWKAALVCLGGSGGVGNMTVATACAGRGWWPLLTTLTLTVAAAWVACDDGGARAWTAETV